MASASDEKLPLTLSANSLAIWSKTCVLSPECVLEPKNVQNLASGVKLIKHHGSKFAIRGGGHMPVSGAQSVDQGVMISMSHFNHRSLSEDQSVASIGPGQTWSEVYDWLAPHSLAVNGGRYPMVGVGGVLLGGGIGYFSGFRGWSIDDVVGWEVVLANGSIVDVAATSGGPHEDLAWALRGGHNHFAVVTRFDMQTFPAGPAFGGLVSYSIDAEEKFWNALITYMAPGGGSDDPKSAINAVASLESVDGGWLYGLINVQLYAEGFAAGDSPRALENFTHIAAEHVTMDISGPRETWTDIPNMMSWIESREYRRTWWAVTLRADQRAIGIANMTFLGRALEDLAHVAELTLNLSFQPLTRVWLQASKDKGGNLLGLDPEQDGGYLAAMLIASWRDDQDTEDVERFIQEAAQRIKDQTVHLGLYSQFVYLNDAGASQKPFDSYAGGANLARLRIIQAKYDEEGFYKNYLQHGFTLESQARSHDEL